MFYSNSKFSLIQNINHCINFWVLKDGWHKLKKVNLHYKAHINLVLRAAQDTVLCGAGNRMWSDSADAEDDNKSAAANFKWKA